MADEKVTVIDGQADIEGRMKGKDAVIHGRFKGEVVLSGRLVIAEGAKVEAAVTADAVEVAGELKGDIRSRALTLAEKARVQGTIDARVLVVREGAWLSGSVASGDQKAAAQAAAHPVTQASPQAGPEKPGALQVTQPPKSDKGA
jgi:cytoskeletal protein CcmA (bactofilin family)